MRHLTIVVSLVAALVAIRTSEGCAQTYVDTLIVGGSPSNQVPDSSQLASLRLAVESLQTEVAGLRSELARGKARGSRETATGVRSLNPDSVAAGAARDLEVARSRLSDLIWMILESLIVILVVFYVIKAASWILEVLAERDARRRLLFKRLVPISRILLWIIAAYLIIDVIFEVTQQQLVAAGAAIGVAVGFAAQDVLKNIFGGLIIILDKPFQVGDKIRIEGTYGEVVSIGLRATRIQTPDDNLVSVPNAQVVDGQVANANAGNLDCQVVTDLYLPGWVDVMKAKQIALEAAANSQYVYLDKPIVVIVQDEFRETFLTHLKVKAYVIDTRFEFRLMSDVTETAKMQFLREGMLVPMIDIETVSQSHLDETGNGQSDQTA